MIPVYQGIGLLEHHTYTRLADNEARINALTADAYEDLNKLNRRQDVLSKRHTRLRDQYLREVPEIKAENVQLRSDIEFLNQHFSEQIEKLTNRINDLESTRDKLYDFNKKLGEINIILLQKIKVDQKIVNELTEVFQNLDLEN